MHLNRRLTAHIGLLLGLALVAGACNGDDPDQATDGTTTTEVDPTTTTTTTEPTTTTFPIEGPEPWTDIVRDLYERLAALNSNPDPTAVSVVASEECDCFSALRQSMEFLVARNEHIEGKQPQPTAVRPEGEPDLIGSQALVVRVESGPFQRVDASGTVVEEVPAAPPSCVSMVVAPTGAAGAYRLHSFFPVQRCPDGL
jgi:hypothetical protein